jgi:hypothetical protein
MSFEAPQNLVITLTGSAGTVTIPIAPALIALDSQNSGGSGQASQQTGFSSTDIAVRNILRAGGFFCPSTGVWYPVSQIENITWS